MNLIEHCKKIIEGNILGDDNPRITLVVKGKWTKSGKKKLFNLPGSPVGTIFSDRDNKDLIVSFYAKEVLAYCEKLMAALPPKEEHETNN